ncbi:MAG: anti-sigma factor [Bacteroidetes bacterium]|nr:anti-sigma factor [Fibrella sp.]
MNLPEYIESGILESYVLGAVSDQERQEVNCLSAVYPEIREELDQLMLAFEEYATMNSVEPPAELKNSIMAQLDFAKPAQEAVVKPMPVFRDEPVQSINSKQTYTYKFTWVVAASFGLVVLAFSYYLFSQLNTAKQSLVTLRTSNETLQANLRQLQVRQQHDNDLVALLSQPGTQVIKLTGNEKAPSGDLSVYWNARSQRVDIDVSSLPSLPADQQYQLWSLVDGKPIDAGVFDAGNAIGTVQRLNRAIGRADAFAVTIEKRGGSPTPNLSNLVAIKELKV